MFKLLGLVAVLIGLLGLISTAVVALVPGDPPSAWTIFTADLDRNGDWEYYRARIGGTDLQRLTINPKFTDPSVWSPPIQRSWHPWRIVAVCGALILFSIVDQETIMFKLLRFVAVLVGLLGLISTAVVALVPGDSPSAWIIFVSSLDGDTDIYRVGIHGSGLQALTVNTAFDSWPVFSPDGQWIAFVSNQDGTKEIYKMRADGSNQEQLTSGPGDKELPQWSPDGMWIAYTVHWGGTEIYRMLADGTGQQVLTDSSNYDGVPIWSPDGGWIIYVSYQDGNEEIYRMRPGGSQQQRLTHDPSYDTSPAISPDGQWIVYEAENINEIFLMRADGHEKQNLTQSPAWLDNSPVWSPDGDWIVYVSEQNGNTDLYRMRPDGSQKEQLTTNPGYDHSPAISPDGQWIVYNALYHMPTICRMRVDGVEQRCFMIQDAYLPQWSPPIQRSWHPWQVIAGSGVFILFPILTRRR